MDKLGTHQLMLALDDANMARLVEQAEAQGIPPAQLASDVVGAFLVNSEKRLAFLQEGTDSLNRYKSTGLHVTDTEIGTWIAELEAGDDDALPPLCHV